MGPKTEFNTSLLGDLDLDFSGSNYDPYPTSWSKSIEIWTWTSWSHSHLTRCQSKGNNANPPTISVCAFCIITMHSTQYVYYYLYYDVLLCFLCNCFCALPASQNMHGLETTWPRMLGCSIYISLCLFHDSIIWPFKGKLYDHRPSLLISWSQLLIWSGTLHSPSSIGIWDSMLSPILTLVEPDTFIRLIISNFRKILSSSLLKI